MSAWLLPYFWFLTSENEIRPFPELIGLNLQKAIERLNDEYPVTMQWQFIQKCCFFFLPKLIAVRSSWVDQRPSAGLTCAMLSKKQETIIMTQHEEKI